MIQWEGHCRNEKKFEGTLSDAVVQRSRNMIVLWYIYFHKKRASQFQTFREILFGKKNAIRYSSHVKVYFFYNNSLNLSELMSERFLNEYAITDIDVFHTFENDIQHFQRSGNSYVEIFVMRRLLLLKWISV